MTALGFAGAAAAGCGGGGRGASSPGAAESGPKAALRPAGDGWFCWQDETFKHVSGCQREKDGCEKQRQSLIDQQRGSARPHRFTECAVQAKASCFTLRLTAGGIDRFQCYVDEGDCVARSEDGGVRPDGTEFATDLSECGEW